LILDLDCDRSANGAEELGTLIDLALRKSTPSVGDGREGGEAAFSIQGSFEGLHEPGKPIFYFFSDRIGKTGQTNTNRMNADSGKRRFESALLESIDEGLALPREIVKDAIYLRIERSYQIRREEIPEKLVSFQKALGDLLGSVVAVVIGKVMAKHLYRRLGLDFQERPSWTLVDYVNNAKKIKRA
jgi:hypothetical protein